MAVCGKYEGQSLRGNITITYLIFLKVCRILIGTKKHSWLFNGSIFSQNCLGPTVLAEIMSFIIIINNLKLCSQLTIVISTVTYSSHIDPLKTDPWFS